MFIIELPIQKNLTNIFSFSLVFIKNNLYIFNATESVINEKRK